MASKSEARTRAPECATSPGGRPRLDGLVARFLERAPRDLRRLRLNLVEAELMPPGRAREARVAKATAEIRGLRDSMKGAGKYLAKSALG